MARFAMETKRGSKQVLDASGSGPLAVGWLQVST